MAELLIKQLHRLARELGEDVPVDMPAEPCEAVGRERGWGWEATAGPLGPPLGRLGQQLDW